MTNGEVVAEVAAQGLQNGFSGAVGRHEDHGGCGSALLNPRAQGQAFLHPFQGGTQGNDQYVRRFLPQRLPRPGDVRGAAGFDLVTGQRGAQRRPADVGRT